MTIAEVLWVFGAAIFILLALLIVVLMKMWETINGIRTRMNGIYDYLSDIDGKLDYFDGDLEELRTTAEANNKMLQIITDACDEDDEEEEEDEDELPIHLIAKEQYGDSGYAKNELEYDPATGDVYLVWLFGKINLGKDVKSIIGDALTYFGVCSKNNNTAYVRNHNIHVDYKITKV